MFLIGPPYLASVTTPQANPRKQLLLAIFKMSKLMYKETKQLSSTGRCVSVGLVGTHLISGPGLLKPCNTFTHSMLLSETLVYLFLFRAH